MPPQAAYQIPHEYHNGKKTVKITRMIRAKAAARLLKRVAQSENPDQMLMFAVLEQAILELGEEKPIKRASAVTYLTTSACYLNCALADIHPAFLRDTLRRAALIMNSDP